MFRRPQLHARTTLSFALLTACTDVDPDAASEDQDSGVSDVGDTDPTDAGSVSGTSSTSAETSGTSSGSQETSSADVTSSDTTSATSSTTASTSSGEGTSSSGGTTTSSSSGGSEGESGGSDETGGGGDTVRFIVVGDAGKGNEEQFQVADAMEEVCDASGCDFVLFLGDNFYETGVESNMDAQFASKFEEPYANLDLRFYVVLGNHDYGLIFNSWEKAAYEIAYTQLSDKWYLPSEWYEFEAGPAHFFALDTAQLMYDRNVAPQQTWLNQALAQSTARWKIAFGHHPLFSNGAHGNAGNYEGWPFPAFISGSTVRSVLEGSVCGKAQIYFSGHDHTRQWLEPQCGTHFLVSGAGAQITAMARRDGNGVRYEDDSEVGFLWVEIAGDLMTGIFYDTAGNPDYTDTIQL